MDYDRNDALLHWLFKQTQGDAWFRANEESISSGVALRVSDAEYRVFPYEDPTLEPFEQAVVALNPLVAVKVRSAAVHAALGEVSAEDHYIYVDSETRIQVLDTMLMLPQADREQCAAFIRDERVMVVWSESIDRIVPLCQDFEERLIKLLWRSRPLMHSAPSAQHIRVPLGPSLRPTGPLIPSRSNTSANPDGSLNGHSSFGGGGGSRTPSLFHVHGSVHKGVFGELGRDPEDYDVTGMRSPATPHTANALASDPLNPPLPRQTTKKVEKRTWYGRNRWGIGGSKRPVKLFAPIYNGLAAGLALWRLDGDATRFALVAVSPLLYCVSLPKPNKAVDNHLPHVTIQMPVYKESLKEVLEPSIRSLKKAMQTYARQGGTSTIFINDDGLRLLPAAERDERLAFYANHNIGWVARPRHDDAADGFKRAGRFKKASNMNYGLALSLKMEKHLEQLIAQGQSFNPRDSTALTRSDAHGSSNENGSSTQYGIQYQNRHGDDSVVWGSAAAGNHNGLSEKHLSMPVSPFNPSHTGRSTPQQNPNNMGVAGGQTNPLAHWGDSDMEERALGMAIEETWEESGSRFRPWAANGKACRIGEIVLIVDSDTIVPEDCLRDAAREMAESPTVAIIQHESDVLQVAHHYFENGIAYFTRRINKCISISAANGEVAPFVGHNAFLRWRAIQDAAFVDPADNKVKIWSESNVSEDFDMALRLILKGYIIRWATYSDGGFKEGVSLTVDDELNRWQKYAYGCNELLFNPIVQWWKKGPIAHQIHKFLWSNAPLHYKISMMAYMFSYYGIAGGITIAVINYVLLGFQFPVDGYFMHSFEIWLATTVVFWGSGTVGYTLLEYRLGKKSLLGAFAENLMWIPFFFFFFGGLSIPVTQAILAHFCSYNMTWAATKKEVERSNFFKEIPKIVKRFWFPLLLSIILIAAIIILSTSLIPFEWRITGEGWAVILPLAMTAACHILFPIVLNPWLMVFSY
ncbi:glycosyl transferase family group 2-domain-containing protein [Coprinopsis sp. MPI-PUGE-AT-0042]|nr:glycosyl transferase family group 2-domain-containing protein [Coprinopsis sp. MPI-PUGE-AT-0042]